MSACIVCFVRDSGATGTTPALLQGAAATVVAFVLEEGITATQAGLCPRHRGHVDLARREAQGMTKAGAT